MKAVLRKYGWYQTLRGLRSVWRATLRVAPAYSTRFRGLKKFFQDMRAYRAVQQTPFIFSWSTVAARVFDDTGEHEEDPTYFYQDSWCAGKVLNKQPHRHVDVGSKLEMNGIISQLVPTTMIDIRPADVNLPGLTFLKGDITALPLPENSVSSLSSICVIEHIGLGRYGDTLDPEGTSKAARELVRVLAPGGNLYISVPVEGADALYFNSHRVFTRDTVLSLFSGLALTEEKYIYGRRLEPHFNPTTTGTGLFHFIK